jgi:hypothetical protein
VTPLGSVVRLQVQRAPLKPGSRGSRVYDPSPLLEVEALDVGPRGCTGRAAGEQVLDVHHADHPQTRNRRLGNGLSLLSRTAYVRLRQAYGDHLVDGIAGESVLLDTFEPGAGGLLLETDDGATLELYDVVPAPPCVEFSRFALDRDLGPVDDELLAALSALDDGARGWYASTAGAGRVRVGGRVWRA